MVAQKFEHVRSGDQNTRFYLKACADRAAVTAQDSP
jgi:hypothetical protein